MRKSGVVTLLVLTLLLLPAAGRAAGVHDGQLFATSCSSASACSAVGSYASSTTGLPMPLAERFNGTSWQQQAIPVPAGTQWADLSGVSCPASFSCVAVGTLHISGISHAWVMAWNGSAWQQQTAAIPPGSKVSGLASVACQSSVVCTAVGNYALYQKPSQTLAEAWNGAQWQLESSPNTSANTNKLLSVACSSASSCLAVGYGDDTSGVERPLAERWGGTAWQIQPTPNPGGSGALLQGVACATSTSCTAVGATSTSASQQTLAEHYDGSAWLIQPTPAPRGAAASSLAGIACPASGSCLAVGTFSPDGTHNDTLIERQSGSTWTVQGSPNASGAFGSFLQGVACTLTTACQAVGYSEPTSTTVATLAEGYSGTSWAIEPTQ
jgi:hypothetical protein